ncbi:hypothetical protein G9A89_002319 [Geosiphon pyriformis]|nr:hypothetical protein G9A89_002319 [Geosiphon pyriformis]
MKGIISIYKFKFVVLLKVVISLCILHQSYLNRYFKHHEQLRVHLKNLLEDIEPLNHSGSLNKLLLFPRSTSKEKEEQFLPKEIIRDQGFLKELAKYADMANMGNCLPNNEVGSVIPEMRVTGGVFVDESTQEIVAFFRGSHLSKGDWFKRNSSMIPYEYPGMEPNLLIQVDKEWYENVNKMKEKLFQKITEAIDSLDSDHKKIRFVGHGVGGAYAVLSALAFHLESRMMRNRQNSIFLGFENIVYTYGEPRIGNMMFARVINELLRVRRVTHTNDYFPHFPKFEENRNLWQHHGREYWIAKPPCDCIQEDLFDFISIVGGGYVVYSCQAIGEHPDCNTSQTVSEYNPDIPHFGPYFRVIMGNCEPIIDRILSL